MMGWLVRAAVVALILFVVVPALWGTAMQVAFIALFVLYRLLRRRKVGRA